MFFLTERYAWLCMDTNLCSCMSRHEGWLYAWSDQVHLLIQWAHYATLLIYINDFMNSSITHQNNKIYNLFNTGYGVHHLLYFQHTSSTAHLLQEMWRPEFLHTTFESRWKRDCYSLSWSWYCDQRYIHIIWWTKLGSFNWMQCLYCI